MNALRSLRRLLPAALAVPLLAQAHGEADAGPALWSAWNTDLSVLVPLGLSGSLYALGVLRLWRRAGRGAAIRPAEAAAFAAGWLALFVALVSPLDALGNELFSAHMAQHEIMMLLAAPLLVASKPFAAFLWGLPAAWRRRLGALGNSRPIAVPWAFCTRPLPAWTIHAVILWVWHLPFLFQAAVGDNLVHTLQHLGFLLSALLFWRAMADRRRGFGGWATALYIFTTAVHTSVLGALLTFSPTPWYPVYAATAAWGLTPVEDQQLGGLIMWVPGNAIYLFVTLLLLLRSLQATERKGVVLARRE